MMKIVFWVYLSHALQKKAGFFMSVPVSGRRIVMAPQTYYTYDTSLKSDSYHLCSICALTDPCSSDRPHNSGRPAAKGFAAAPPI
jgi:hypothetical protein